MKDTVKKGYRQCPILYNNKFQINSIQEFQEGDNAKSYFKAISRATRDQ